MSRCYVQVTHAVNIISQATYCLIALIVGILTETTCGVIRGM